MPEFELSGHAKEMLAERNILEEWVWRTVNTSTRKRMGEDGNLHFTKAIKEKDRRVLHVVVNPNSDPRRIVTVFFDRRLSKKTEKRK
ncbi:MAG: DUF4258 domain-containing protein [Acidobacteriota bacterium]|nr:DUF4258 domain-containing protein [Acidobacteriota bacterium]